MKCKITADFSKVLLISYLFVFLGGLPLSFPILKIHSKVTGKEVYSYNINRNIIISRQVEGLKIENDLKSNVYDLERFLEIMDQKKINIKEIPSKDNKERKFRVDGQKDVERYFNTLNKLHIKLPSIESKFLSNEEIVIIVKE